MSDERHDHTPEEREALQSLASSKLKDARPVVRARARAAFMGNELRAQQRTPAPRRRPAPWIYLVAAASLAGLLFRMASEPVDAWNVVELIQPEGIVADQELVVGESFDGGELRLGAGSELELLLGNHLRLRVLEDTVVELPHGPGRWINRERTLRLLQGEAFGSSHEGGLGFTLNLDTSEARATLTGTSFAVIRNAEATCFCLYRGGLEIRATGSDQMIELPVEHRVFIYRDGRPPEIMPIDGGERMKLEMMENSRPED
jgi:ferric-dicitrate binding protein FerR (iron transport regulator)